MKLNRLKTILFVILLFSLFTVFACAEDAVVTGNDVNFRSGPGMNYEVTDCLENGTVVTVNDRSDSTWYSVSYNGKTGFVSALYLSIQETVQEEPAVQTPEAELSVGTINAMYVRFRSGPSTDYSILGEVNSGTPVIILGAADGWSHVTVNGQDGYVFSDYISLPSDEAAPAEQAPEEIPLSTVAEPPIGETEPAAPAVPAEPAAPVVESESKAGHINADYVRFRTGPGTAYSILSSYNRNQAVTVTGTSGDWSKVTIGTQEGYVFTSYITLDTVLEAAPAQTVEEAPAEAAKGYVKGTSVRLRSQASLSSAILGEFNTGTELLISGTSGDWTKVTVNGQAGYIFSTYVTEIAPAVSTQGSSEGQKIANYALQFLGYPYVWAGTSPEEGFDCSGLVNYVYSQFGYDIHRVACDMAGDGVHVEPDELQPGDILCFYSSDSYIGHVGIYIGNDQFIHSSTYTTGVIISDLESSYYARNFEARRIVG